MTDNTLNILLVEDVEIASKVAVLTLKQLSCPLHIDTAATGAAALELFKYHKYEIVFMDLGLPDTSGIELVKQMRKLQEGKHIPIVALTAHGDDSYRQDCQKAGMVDFIEKPLRLEDCPKIFSKLGLL